MLDCDLNLLALSSLVIVGNSRYLVIELHTLRKSFVDLCGIDV